MKRRNFLKTTAAGSAFLITSGSCAFNNSAKQKKIPVNDDIQKALDSAAPGDTIILKDGVYYQNLVITRGGTPGKPITLKAANGGAATLSGAVPPEEAKRIKFELVEGDLYKAAVPHRVWWVMVGPRNLVNYGKLDLLKKFLFPAPGNGELKQSVPEGFAWQDGTLYIRLEKEADPNTAAIQISRLTGGHTSAEPEFAKEGRWAPDTGFDVPALGHLYSRTLGLITVKADNVVIEGLRMHMGVGAAVIVHGNDVTVRDCYITGSHLGICQPDEVKLPPEGPRPITPSSRTARGLTVEYCEFSSPPGYEMCQRGFWGGLYAANISGVFMNYGGPRSVVRHNWIYDTAQDHLQPRGNGTSAPEDASEIAYNLLQNSGDDSIEFDSASPMNLRVHHNVLLDGMILLALSPVMGGGLTIDHNILYNSPEHGLEWSGLFKGGSPWGSALPTKGMRIVHNTMVNTQGHDIALWWVGGHVYENNILENNIFYVAQSQNFSAPGLAFSHHNLYCGPKVDPKHIPEMMHYEGSPFVSMNPMDFALRADGPAVDAGVAGKEYHHEARGEAPDLGAIELGETWQFPRPGPRWAKGNEIANRPMIPASLPLKWVGLE